jgi:hypothetical protein
MLTRSARLLNRLQVGVIAALNVVIALKTVNDSSNSAQKLVRNLNLA